MLLNIYIIALIINLAQNICHQNSICSKNCYCCQSNQICTRCYQGYILYNNFTCSNCPCVAQNCLQCDCNSSNLCINCQLNYQLDASNKCSKNISSQIQQRQKNSQSSLGTIVLVFICIGTVVLIIIMIFGLVFWIRKCKNKKKLLPIYPIINPPERNSNITFQQSINYLQNNTVLLTRQNKRIRSALKSQRQHQIINQQLSRIPINSSCQYFQYNNQRDNCAVCLENNCNAITLCSHYFHLECLRAWINKHQNCPVCKNTSLSKIKFVTCSECKNKIMEISIMSQKPQIKCQKCHFQSEYLTIKIME